MELDQSESEIVDNLIEKKDLWFMSSKYWIYAHWTISILAVVLSTLAAASNVVGDYAGYFSVGASLCVGILSVASPQKQSNQNLKGFLLMEDGLFHYKCSLINISQLLEIYGRAEAAVHDNIQQPPQTAPTTLGLEDKPKTP